MSLIVKIKKQLDNFMLSVDMELTDEIVSRKKKFPARLQTH